jgi:pimeloyl-ACP methyl ester carboxylesterase
VFDSMWDTDESYTAKYSRLMDFCEEIELGVDEELTVIGVSAGGSLAIRYLHENPDVDKAYLVAGKLRGSKSIGENYQKRSPALLESVRISEGLLATRNGIGADTTVMRALFDNIVPLNDMLIENARRIRIPIIGHTFSIGLALILYFPRLLKSEHRHLTNK